jgi:Pyridine nucleotide-disulphide oxidoreductase
LWCRGPRALGARRGRRAPDIPGFADVWGTSAHTFPYCDGFEHRDERLAVLASGARGEHLAVLLRHWSGDVVLLSNGPHDLAVDQLARVNALGIRIIETPVVALDGDERRLRRIRLDSGETLDRDSLFFYVGWRLRNDVARSLGCRLRDDGSIAVDSEQATTADRVYARQLRRTARARAGRRRLGRDRRGRHQRPLELRGRRPRDRRLPRAGRLQGSLTRTIGGLCDLRAEIAPARVSLTRVTTATVTRRAGHACGNRPPAPAVRGRP